MNFDPVQILLLNGFDRTNIHTTGILRKIKDLMCCGVT